MTFFLSSSVDCHKITWIQTIQAMHYLNTQLCVFVCVFLENDSLNSFQSSLFLEDDDK